MKHFARKNRARWRYGTKGPSIKLGRLVGFHTKPSHEFMNYQHLFYFFTVAKQGGVSAAARALDLAPSTLSAQIRLLETSMATQLFERKGRAMILTDAGRVAYGYAENIFSLGDELRSKLTSSAVETAPSATAP